MNVLDRDHHQHHDSSYLSLLPIALRKSSTSIQCLYRADDKNLYYSANTIVSMCRSLQENVTYKFVQVRTNL